jgi:BolA protein
MRDERMSNLAQAETKLREAFMPSYLLVSNESHLHRSAPGAESHLKVVLVSACFQGKRLLARHRLVNDVLSEELAGSLHALALHTYTNDEWSALAETAPLTPNCRGGEK